MEIVNNLIVGNQYRTELSVPTTNITQTYIGVVDTTNFPATGTILIGGVTSVNYTSKTATSLVFASTVIPTYAVGTAVLVTSAGSYTEIEADGTMKFVGNAKIKPATDITSAVRFTKADGSTDVMRLDTENGAVEITGNLTATNLSGTNTGDQDLSGYSQTGHTHDDRYYTESEVDILLLGKSNTGHTHNYLPLTGGTLTGSVTGSTFVKSGGTSNEFLKADGSVDSKVYITLNDIPSQVITENIPVSLSGGKTLGKYVNGQTIMSSGMTVTQLFKDIAIEALSPTVSLSSPTTIAFNQTSISNVLNFTYVINSLGATVQSVSLDWRRGGIGSWVNLTTNTGSTTYTHNYTDTSGNTSSFNYRYVVTDTAGGVATGTTNITPASYVAPSINSMSVGSTSRDLGNISSTISATIVRNSVNVLLSTYKIQRSVNGGSYSDISGTLTTISGSSWNVSYVDNDNTLLNSTTISYKIVVTDIYSTTTGSVATISFTHRSFLGYSINSVLSLSDILGLSNSTLTNSKSRTIAGVTAGVGNYTYYVYASSAGDLSNCLLDGVEAILGAFTKLSDVTGTNSYGANVSYRVYKSNSTNAFTNNSLTFS